VDGHRFSGQSWPAKVVGGLRVLAKVGLRALPRQGACTADLVPVAAAHYRGGQAF